MFHIGDAVKVFGEADVCSVVGLRDAEPCYQIQRGADAATKLWKRNDELELVAKAKMPDIPPGLVPDRGIME
jgi:hypothetical protein